MKEIELFIERLKQTNDFGLYFETVENSLTAKFTIENLTLEFYLKYDVHFFNIISATHEQPEEFDAEIECTSYEDIALYKGAEFIELTDLQISEIDVQINRILFN